MKKIIQFWSRFTAAIQFTLSAKGYDWAIVCSEKGDEQDTVTIYYDDRANKSEVTTLLWTALKDKDVCNFTVDKKD